MKNHLLSLFNQTNKPLTVFLMLSSAALILTGLLIGVADNLPGILLLFTGIISMFFGLVHPWTNWKYYAWLAIISAGIIGMTILVMYILVRLNLERYISEGVVLEIFVVVPGIIVGVLGAIYWAVKGKKRNKMPAELQEMP